MNNIFLGASDPLLNSSIYPQGQDEIESYMQKLQEAQAKLEQQKRLVLNSNKQTKKTSLWDEIDNEISTMTDGEFQSMGDNPEFQQSNATVMSILNREYLKIMRPIVEDAKDGQESLSRHLDLVRKLKKQSKEEINKNLELFNEYTEHHSDMTYADFLKMKKGGKKK